MKLKKLKKVFFSLFLAFSMFAPLPNLGFCNSTADALAFSRIIKFIIPKSVGRFFSDFFYDFLKKVTTDVLWRFMENRGYLDVDNWGIIVRYGEDLTELARSGRIHDCIERDKEISDLIYTLISEDKGNVMITGAAGVGKTALIEGLACRIATGNVPECFKSKKIIRINMVALIAGNTYNGSDNPVARIRSMLSAAESDPDTILFVDEFHQIARIGAAELFKNYLDRNKVKMIAATTNAEYEYIKSDDALARRFKQIVVNEPSKDQTMQILNRLKPEIEKKYNVKVSKDAISAAIEYTDKYMRGKSFPDKAINVIYTVSKMVSVNNVSTADENGIVSIPTVTGDDVISAISREVRIPFGKVTPKEQEFLDSIEQRVKNVVVGQDKAVKKFCKAIKKSRFGIKNYNRPNCSLFFTGTSGVGKSKLAQVIGNEINSTIEVDFSNYTESDSMKKLLNSKIFGFNGGLAEKIFRKPYSIVIFDNLEKAHPNTIKDVLSIIKKGYILDSKGNEVDFRNAFIVINSKIGEKEMLECPSCIPTNEVTKKINQKIKDCFGEEFFDNLDDVIVFNKLDGNSMKKIVNASMDVLENVLDYKNIKIKITDDVRNFICNMPINHKLGSASYDSFLDKYISKPLNKAFSGQKIKENNIVKFVLNKGKVELKIEQMLGK